MATIKYEISVAKLRNAYLTYCKTHYQADTCFCWVLMDSVIGYVPVDSKQVIEQFVRVKPERFVVGRRSMHFITSQMKAKYRNVKDPRLALLNSMPDEHVLEFEMCR